MDHGATTQHHKQFLLHFDPRSPFYGGFGIQKNTLSVLLLGRSCLKFTTITGVAG